MDWSRVWLIFPDSHYNSIWVMIYGSFNLTPLVNIMFSFKLFDDDVTDNMAKTLYLQPSLNTDYAGLVSVILDGQQAHYTFIPLCIKPSAAFISNSLENWLVLVTL
jgi:hypothetical protein